MQLIAVVLAAPTSADRFAGATRLLDYGFANYSVVNAAEKIGELQPLPVIGGKTDIVTPLADKNVNFIVKKGNQDKVEVAVTFDEPLRAPLEKNQKIGSATLTVGNDKLAVCDILAAEKVERMNVTTMFWEMFQKWVCIPN
jgi:D-alanyl-D-alanine carboxypeptidase (penicillin-binding protein 5/6)